jgi:hypothetical protein
LWETGSITPDPPCLRAFGRSAAGAARHVQRDDVVGYSDAATIPAFAVDISAPVVRAVLDAAEIHGTDSAEVISALRDVAHTAGIQLEMADDSTS